MEMGGREREREKGQAKCKRKQEMEKSKRGKAKSARNLLCGPSFRRFSRNLLGSPRVDTGLESRAPYLLEGIADFQLDLAIHHALDAEASQIFHNPVRSGFLELRERVSGCERNDLKPGRLASPDA